MFLAKFDIQMAIFRLLTPFISPPLYISVRTTCGGTYTHIVENYGQLQSPWYSATPSNYSNGLDCDYVIGPARNIVLFFESFDVPSVPAGNCDSDSLTVSQRLKVKCVLLRKLSTSLMCRPDSVPASILL